MGNWSLDDSLGDVLDDDVARAVLDEIFPGMSAAEGVDAGRPYSLNICAQFSPDVFTPEKVKLLEEKLSQL